MGITMRKHLKKAVALLVSLAVLGIVRASQAQTIQSTSLSLISPSACPSSGCAAGQRLNMRGTFSINEPFPGVSPHLQMCIYTPANWAAEDLQTSTIGQITGATYQPDISHCSAAPANYSLLGGASATYSSGFFGDSLDFVFRIGANAAAQQNGSTLIRILEQTAPDVWTQTDQAFILIPVVAVANTHYVANDAPSCSVLTPCYVNSGDDLADGIGTALKDAIDAHPAGDPATIYILGDYQIKSNTVLLDKPLNLLGLNDAKISYSGLTCTQPMMRITAGASIGSLTITDGSCSSPSRNLLVIDSPVKVTIESSDLLGGKDAVHMLDNAGDLELRFNQIMDNSGYAVLRDTVVSAGAIDAVANNLYNNRSGFQMDCASKGEAEHNFWGFNASPSTAVNQCTATEGKHLGAPGLPRVGAAGIDASLVTVSTSMTYSFNERIGAMRSSDGADFPLFIVNHGYGSSQNVPFTGGLPGNLIPCSNYYDVFLPKGAAPSASLTLAFKYDLNTGCTATIESAPYCGSTVPAQYPLWWYDPASNVTLGWDTTGQNPAGSGAGGASGQETTCNIGQKEIQVVIDATGRPSMLSDLDFTPFVIGLSPVTSSVVFTRFAGIPGDSSATIEWTTSSEANTRGFFVQRSLSSSGGFDRIHITEIPSKGSTQTGSSYSFPDTGLTNGTTYYYRLEIISTTGESGFTGVISVTAGIPTITVTSTVTPTGSITATITPTGPTPTTTGTRTPTRTRTATITRIPTRTRTPVRYSTYFYYRSPTRIPSRTAFPTRTWTLPAATTAAPTLAGTPLLTPGGPSVPAPEQGYPGVQATPSETAPGYPAEETESMATAELTQTLGAAATPTDSQAAGPGSSKGIARLVRIGNRYWPYLLVLLIVELIGLVILGLVLRRKGLLTLPLLPRKK